MITQNNIIFEKNNNILKILFLVVLTSFIYFLSANIFSEIPLWSDEIDGYYNAIKIYENFPANLFSDIHPPIYSILLNLSILLFGENFFGLRFPSFIFSILNILLILNFKFKENLFKYIFLIFFLSSWVVLWYSQEVRPYSLVLLCSTALLLNVYSRINYSRENLTFFIIFSIICLLTHYIFFFLIFGIIIVENLYKKNFRLIISAVIFLSFLSFLLYLFALQKFYSVGEIYQILSSNSSGNLIKNLEFFYKANFFAIYLLLQKFDFKIFYILISIFLIFLPLILIKKNIFKIIYPFLICQLCVFTIFLSNFPRVEFYVYIFLYPFFSLFISNLFFEIYKNFNFKKYLLILLFLYLLISHLIIFFKINNKWNGQTTYHGPYNILTLEEICEISKCIYIRNLNFINFKDVETVLSIESSSSLKNYDTRKFIKNQYTIIVDNPKDPNLILDKEYKCYVLSQSVFRNLIVYLRKPLEPKYVKKSSKLINTFNYHKEKKCFY